jgi:pyruvate formate lyase activating enzyme
MSASTSPSKPLHCKADAITDERAERSADLLRIGGVTAFTATDYPGQLAAVVFVQGCPWRCGYCHNPHLQPREHNADALHWRAVADLLRRRAGLIDAVVFSGGEPTVDPALEAAIEETRAFGFKIGLHSGGAYPKRLQSVLPHLDWIGFDVKARFEDYDKVTGISGSGRHAQAAAEAILASGIEHEFRTTIHPDLLPEHEVLELAQTLARMGVRNYAMQVFRAQGCEDEQLNAACLAGRMAGYPSRDLVQRLDAMFPSFTLRDARQEG